MFIASITPTAFWSSSFGNVLQSFLTAIGCLVVIFAIVSCVKHVAKGDIGKAVKGVLGSVLLAAFLFQPTLATDLINVGGTVVSTVINTVSQLAGGSSTPGTPTTPSSPTGG